SIGQSVARRFRRVGKGGHGHRLEAQHYPRLAHAVEPRQKARIVRTDRVGTAGHAACPNDTFSAARAHPTQFTVNFSIFKEASCRLPLPRPAPSWMSRSKKRVT